MLAAGDAIPENRDITAPRRTLPENSMTDQVLWLDRLRLSDLAQVGGKNASLGEMIGHLAGQVERDRPRP